MASDKDIMIVSGDSYHAADPEKRKIIQQQLVLLLHAHKCQKKKKDLSIDGYEYECSLPHCRAMKNVLTHMVDCTAGRDCPMPHCASSRQIIQHWKTCCREDCPVCLPLKQASDRSRQTNGITVPQELTNDGQVRPNMLANDLVSGGGQRGPTPNNGHQINPNFNNRANDFAGLVISGNAFPRGNATMQNSQLENLPTPPSMVTNSGSFDPAEATLMQFPTGNPLQGATIQFHPTPISSHKDWHRHCTMDLRNHLLHKLVHAIFPYKDPSALQDKRADPLICYARKVEAEMYESANTREEYYQYVAAKIYKIQKELEIKREERDSKRQPPRDPNQKPNPQEQDQAGKNSTRNPGNQIRPISSPDDLFSFEIKLQGQDNGMNTGTSLEMGQNDQGIKSELCSGLFYNELSVKDEMKRFRTRIITSSGNSIDHTTRTFAGLTIGAGSPSQKPFASPGFADALSAVHECRFSNMDPAEKSLCKTEVKNLLIRDSLEFLELKPSQFFLPHPVSTGWYAECQNGSTNIALFTWQQRVFNVHNLAHAHLAKEDRFGPRGDKMAYHMVGFAREMEANYCEKASSEEEYMDLVTDEISRHWEPVTRRLKLINAQRLGPTAPPVYARPTSTSADASSSRVAGTSDSILSDITDNPMKYVKDGLTMLGFLMYEYRNSGQRNPEIEAAFDALKRSKDPNSGSYVRSRLQTNGKASRAEH